MDGQPLCEFRIKGIGFGIPDPGWSFGDGPLDARKATLLAAIQDTGAKSFKYLYFGDGWVRSIAMVRIRIIRVLHRLIGRIARLRQANVEAIRR